MLDNITINEHSSIRIDDKVIAYIYPFRLKEERYDADLILFTHPHFDHFSPEDFRKAAKADTTLSVDERPIGGLGIFLVRELMDSINYERVDGKNMLTLIKKITNQQKKYEN